MLERLKTAFAPSYADRLDAAHRLIQRCDADLQAATEAERVAVEAMGEAALDSDGPVPAAVLKAVATARGAAEAATAARIAAKARLSALIAAGEQDETAACWRAAASLADELVEAGHRLDECLQATATAWVDVQARASKLHGDSPLDMSPYLRADRVAAALELAKARVGLPSKSTWAITQGHLRQPPSVADFCEEVSLYLNSRRPEVARAA